MLNVPIERPPALTVLQDGIDTDLMKRNRWVCWHFQQDGGRWTKKPFSPVNLDYGYQKKSDWSSFDNAFGFYQVETRYCDGIGFVVRDADPYTVLDLDNCFDGRGIRKQARERIEAVDSLTEKSPSGNGAHVWTLANKPGPGCKADDIEIYGGNQFITVTGHLLPDSHRTIQARQTQIDTLYSGVFTMQEAITASIRAGKYPQASLSDTDLITYMLASDEQNLFRRLFIQGDITVKGGDESACDQSLLYRMTFYVGDDTARLDRLFRLSALYALPGRAAKWDSKRGKSGTYGSVSIAEAIRFREQQAALSRARKQARNP